MLALRHVVYARDDLVHRLRVACANESAELSPPPRAAAIAAASLAGTNCSAAAAMAAALAQAGADAACWADANASLLSALRVRTAR